MHQVLHWKQILLHVVLRNHTFAWPKLEDHLFDVSQSTVREHGRKVKILCVFRTITSTKWTNQPSWSIWKLRKLLLGKAAARMYNLPAPKNSYRSVSIFVLLLSGWGWFLEALRRVCSIDCCSGFFLTPPHSQRRVCATVFALITWTSISPPFQFSSSFRLPTFPASKICENNFLQDLVGKLRDACKSMERASQMWCSKICRDELFPAEVWSSGSGFSVNLHCTFVSWKQSETVFWC